MTVFKKGMVGLLALFAVTANATKCDFLDDDQKFVVNRAYELGQKSGYGMTLAALALTESSAGKYLINNVSQDYGVFQNNIKYTSRRIEQITGAPMNKRQVANLKKNLATDIHESATYALLELEFWAARHNYNWKRTIASYNAGFAWSGKAGQTYLAKVSKNLRLLESCNCIQK